MYRIFIFIILLITLFSCDNIENINIIEWNTLNIYRKTEQIISDQMECTPFIWENTLKLLINWRNLQNKTHLEIWDYATNKLISRFAEGYNMASCLVQKNKLIIIATSPLAQKNNYISIIETENLINFSEPLKILTKPNYILFNTSLIHDGQKFILSYETNEGTPFTIRFVESKNLIVWNEIGSVFSMYAYAACPTIRYIDNNYYMWYLAYEKGVYITKIVKSTDLINWEHSKYVFLSPSINIDSNNTSDFDCCEINGEVFITYAVGDQSKYAGIKTAIFNGTLNELVNFYF